MKEKPLRSLDYFDLLRSLICWIAAITGLSIFLAGKAVFTGVLLMSVVLAVVTGSLVPVSLGNSRLGKLWKTAVVLAAVFVPAIGFLALKWLAPASGILSFSSVIALQAAAPIACIIFSSACIIRMARCKWHWLSTAEALVVWALLVYPVLAHNDRRLSPRWMSDIIFEHNADLEHAYKLYALAAALVAGVVLIPSRHAFAIRRTALLGGFLVLLSCTLGLYYFQPEPGNHNDPPPPPDLFDPPPPPPEPQKLFLVRFINKPRLKNPSGGFHFLQDVEEPWRPEDIVDLFSGSNSNSLTDDLARLNSLYPMTGATNRRPWAANIFVLAETAPRAFPAITADASTLEMSGKGDFLEAYKAFYLLPDSNVKISALPVRNIEPEGVDTNSPVLPSLYIDAAVTSQVFELTRRIGISEGDLPAQSYPLMLDWVQSNWAYDKSTSEPGNEGVLLLLENSSGNEEAFARTFVLLARACGIPARVGVGYIYRADLSDNIVVNESHRAYWPEVLDAHGGWNIVRLTNIAEAVQQPPDNEETQELTAESNSLANPPAKKAFGRGYLKGAAIVSVTFLVFCARNLLAAHLLILFPGWHYRLLKRATYLLASRGVLRRLGESRMEFASQTEKRHPEYHGAFKALTEIHLRMISADKHLHRGISRIRGLRLLWFMERATALAPRRASISYLFKDADKPSIVATKGG